MCIGNYMDVNAATAQRPPGLESEETQLCPTLCEVSAIPGQVHGIATTLARGIQDAQRRLPFCPSRFRCMGANGPLLAWLLYL